MRLGTALGALPSRGEAASCELLACSRPGHRGLQGGCQGAKKFEQRTMWTLVIGMGGDHRLSSARSARSADGRC